MDQSKRAIYVLHKNVAWVDVIKDMRTVDVIPAAIVVNSNVADAYRSEFPEAIVVGYRGMYVDVDEIELSSGALPSPDEIDAHEGNILVALKSFDRYCLPNELTFDERYDAYIYFMKIADWLYRSVDTDYIIYQNVPFHSFHLALYYESFSWKGRTLIGTNINFPFRGLIQFKDSIEGDLPFLSKNQFDISCSDVSEKEASSFVEKYDSSHSKYPEAPFYRKVKKKVFLEKLEPEIPRIFAAFSRLGASESFYLKLYLAYIGARCSIKRIVSSNAINSTECTKLNSWRTKTQLVSQYNKLAEYPDVSANFVYFALHYEPERTTVPDGRLFGFQLYAIRMLAEALPVGWRIYVKEH